MNEGLREQVLALLKEDDEIVEVVARRLEQSVLFKELRAFREEVNKRFEAMDRRFEATQDWVGVVVGGFQVKAGRNLEDAVAGTLCVALKMKDLRPETIRLRQKVVDDTGMIGPAGRSYEYDIFATNGDTCVFEVKATPDHEDVDRFADKCELVRKKAGGAPVRRVMVSLAKTPELRDYCRGKGIELV